MEYKFDGYDWEELAECWGITVEEGETIDAEFLIGEQTIKVKLHDEEAVLGEKTKRYIMSNIDYSEEPRFKDEQIRKDLVAYLNTLAVEQRKFGTGAEIIQAIADETSDWALGKWVTENLYRLWS